MVLFLLYFVCFYIVLKVFGVSVWSGCLLFFVFNVHVCVFHVGFDFMGDSCCLRSVCCLLNKAVVFIPEALLWLSLS